MASSPLHLRIFLSSPGDVAAERRTARELLNAVQRQPMLRGRVWIDAISYDDPDAPAPMAAGETPQESVNRLTGRPADCDLTVVILWGRLGTPIPPHVQRADGTRYESGTVWELEDALQAGKEVWVYRRTEVPSIALNDPDFEKRRAAYEAVGEFFKRFTNADGSIKRGCNTYARDADFGGLFEKHLASLIRARLEAPSRGGEQVSTPAAVQAELAVSSLTGARRVRPLSGHPILARNGAATPIHTGGAQVSFTLAHNGAGRQSISVYALELELLRHAPGSQPDLAYEIEGAEIQGAGLARPHVFSVSLRGSQVGPACWVMDARTGQIAISRSANFFDTQEPRVLTLRADTSETEELQGTILAQQTGLYELRFVFFYSAGGVDRQHASEVLHIYFDE
jgi:hypothetical protein